MHVAAWMIRHAPSLINGFRVGRDGHTPYSRVRGNRFSREIQEFGESMLYLLPESVGTHKYDSRWERGIWLGATAASGEYIMGTEKGTLKMGSVKPLELPEEQWNYEATQKVQRVPWEVVPGSTGIDLSSRILLPEDRQPIIQDDFEEGRRLVRRMRVTRADVEGAGMAAGCPGCIASTRNVTPQGGIGSHAEREYRAGLHQETRKDMRNTRTYSLGRSLTRWSASLRKEERRPQWNPLPAQVLVRFPELEPHMKLRQDKWMSPGETRPKNPV